MRTAGRVHVPDKPIHTAGRVYSIGLIYFIPHWSEYTGGTT